MKIGNKKFILMILILSGFLVSSCDTSWENDIIFRSNCNNIDNLTICEENNGEDISRIFNTDEENKGVLVDKLCKINNGENPNSYLEEVLSEKMKTKNLDIIFSEKDNNKELNIEASEKDNNIENEINILYDLTYFVFKKTTRDEVAKIRRNNLIDYLDSIDINDGTKINLMYIGSTDYGTKDAVIKSIDTFKIGSKKDKVDYYSMSYRCDIDNRLSISTLYYDFNEGTINKNTNIDNDKDEVINSMLNKIDEMYDSGEYTRGTFLIETLANYPNFLNSENINSENIILSDFGFQLHKRMKGNKNITLEDINLWEFPPKNLDDYKDDSSEYSELYKNEIINDYLKDKCNNNEKLTLIGLWLDDNLDRQIIMKDYYKNYLFEGCDVIFK